MDHELGTHRPAFQIVRRPQSYVLTNPVGRQGQFLVLFLSFKCRSGSDSELQKTQSNPTQPKPEAATIEVLWVNDKDTPDQNNPTAIMIVYLVSLCLQIDSTLKSRSSGQLLEIKQKQLIKDAAPAGHNWWHLLQAKAK